nr:hypothetical protein [Nostoc sp. CreGUA01]
MVRPNNVPSAEVSISRTLPPNTFIDRGLTAPPVPGVKSYKVLLKSEIKKSAAVPGVALKLKATAVIDSA